MHRGNQGAASGRNQNMPPRRREEREEFGKEFLRALRAFAVALDLPAQGPWQSLGTFSSRKAA
jgi:hypothetical protein